MVLRCCTRCAVLLLDLANARGRSRVSTFLILFFLRNEQEIRTCATQNSFPHCVFWTAAGSTRKHFLRKLDKVEAGLYMRHFQKKLEYIIN